MQAEKCGRKSYIKKVDLCGRGRQLAVFSSKLYTIARVQYHAYIGGAYIFPLALFAHTHYIQCIHFGCTQLAESYHSFPIPSSHSEPQWHGEGKNSFPIHTVWQTQNQAQETTWPHVYVLMKLQVLYSYICIIDSWAFQKISNRAGIIQYVLALGGSGSRDPYGGEN